jgi:hypothetical protein
MSNRNYKKGAAVAVQRVINNLQVSESEYDTLMDLLNNAEAQTDSASWPLEDAKAYVAELRGLREKIELWTDYVVIEVAA